MKSHYFLCLLSGAAFFALILFSPKLSLVTIGLAAMYLLAIVNREIRMSVNGVPGMPFLLIGAPLNKGQHEYIDTISYCGEELEKKDFELRSCVAEAHLIFARKIGEGGPELACCIDSRVPEKVNGDRKRLSQILIHLLENAVTHTREGEIILSIRNQRSGQGNKIELVFEIQDTGSGIPANKIGQLFKRIAPQERNGDGEKQPAGPGLVLCKMLVESMGGTIHVQSEPGWGTRFTFNVLFDPALN